MRLKNKKLNELNNLYKKLFSLETITDSYRKGEIMLHLLFDKNQKTIIEYLDLPDFKESSHKEFNSAKKCFIENSVDTELNEKVKTLL